MVVYSLDLKDDYFENFQLLKNGEKTRSQIWNFLKDLEVDMKDWLNGVDVEVPDIIRNAGYQVRSKY